MPALPLRGLVLVNGTVLVRRALEDNGAQIPSGAAGRPQVARDRGLARRMNFLFPLCSLSLTVGSDSPFFPGGGREGGAGLGFGPRHLWVSVRSPPTPGLGATSGFASL